MSMASSSFVPRWRYDIFLSFRGEDTRRNFVQHLFSALCLAGFHTFWDDAELRIGENISLQVERAIEWSKLSIIVISRKYASSPWFLDILLKILACKERLGQQVIPIFLNVDPSEVLGVFSQAFVRHDERHEADSRVNRWRVALQMIGKIYGWDLQNVEDHWHESKFIQKIVEDVSHMLSQMCRSTVLHLIGPEPPVAQFVSILDMGSICNLTRLKPPCLVHNNLNQLQLIGTNKLKSYPESIGSCFSLEELQANDNSIEELRGSISNRVVLKQLCFNNNILNQGLDSASFEAKQKYKEEMGAQRSPLPLTLSGCPSMLPTERFDSNKVTVEQDKGESSKMKDENVEKAHKLKHDLVPDVGWRTFSHFSLKDIVKFSTMTSAKGIDGMGEKQQGLTSASFDTKQKDEEEMGAQRSTLPLTLSGCSSMLPTERFDHNKVAVEQDKGESSKMKGENVQNARNLKPFELEKLPEHLLNLFPSTYEFEKETVVQLWVAEGFFEPEVGDRMEILANSHFDYLIEKKYVLPSRYDSVRGSMKYKITDAIHRSLRNAPQVSYLKVEEAQLGSVSEQIQHLFLISKNINPASFKILSRFEHLHTLVLFCQLGSSIGRVPHDLFSSVKQLRSLGLRQSGISEIPISIGSLKCLRYLDVSKTPIKYLPNSIVYLYNLQTLKLDGCLNLVGLPLQLSKLAKLRHLEFDILGRLTSMPVKMGNLSSLQTLRAFLVGREDGCRIEELKNLIYLSGSFCISGLENVLTSHEAKEAAMTNKKYISKLELRWGRRDIGRSKVDEEILDCLQPDVCLQELRILSYGGSVFPDWINSSYLCNIVNVTLCNCRNCLVLPSLGGLPLLKSLYIIEVMGVGVIDGRFHRSYGNEVYQAFPKLEKLTIGGMYGLKEWSGVKNGDFPCLSLLIIRSCPKLVALQWLSYLCSLKYLEISGCEEISSLCNEELPSSLEFLSITDCPKLKEKYCKPEASGWFQIAHVPSILIDLVQRSMKDEEDKGLTQS